MSKVMIRLRMSSADAHYGGGLVDGAKLMELFGDVATELLIRHDGDEGLFVSYTDVQFTAPIFEGDYIEAVGEIVEVGNSSRKMEFEARKVITSVDDKNLPESARKVLDEPVIAAKAKGVCVVPKDKQRN